MNKFQTEEQITEGVVVETEKPVTEAERRAAIRREQKGMSKKETLELMRNRYEYAVDLDKMESREHIWVDRGMVLSCEGAGHPNHRVYKRARGR